MKANIIFIISALVIFLPFFAFVLLNSKANMKKEIRHRQYIMPIVAVIYSLVLLIFMSWLSGWLTVLMLKLADFLNWIKLTWLGDGIRKLYQSWGIYLILLLFNIAALFVFILIKRIVVLCFSKKKVEPDSFFGSVLDLFYSYDEQDECWYIKEHFGQARTFVKSIYYGGSIVSGIALLVSLVLCMKRLISAPFYPVFAVIIIGEIAFFIDGLEKGEQKSIFSVQTDTSAHVAMYPLLRKPLKDLFGDKLSAEGTTVNNAGMTGGGLEDILVNLEKEGGHIGTNYAAFIRKKMGDGLKPNIDYVRSGYELATGKSLLFNTPFYDKLNPYAFYAMNRALLTGGKVMIVLGRHGTEEDLYRWCENGMKELSNVPNLWKISVLDCKKTEDDELCDIGIVSCASVHDLNVHKANLPFFKEVSFVMVVEPSRLVATAQIGLNLLIKNCGQHHPITFCSVDRNCDGLVDALSHILMTNITEVSATEYPHGISSFMYWTAGNEYMHHRILPGVSRCLGMGTALSAVALKNQVKKTVWYGGDAYPVRDARWIAKQYYYDLLDYAQLPTSQETFDHCFQTSFNLCDERVGDYSYITVEDDRNNLFEIRRNFATIAEQQGFVNVVSTEYMLREYMSSNPDIFTADAKAIPYITADYARTKRNVVLTLCLLLSVDLVSEENLRRQLKLLSLDAKDLSAELWREICVIFCDQLNPDQDENGNPILSVECGDGEVQQFKKDETILFKRVYSVESGQFESVYTIENTAFIQMILDDLQNASYIAEQENKDVYIGTELKGHVYQKYMPGQFFTLSGKYYEMVSTTADNRILVRRAADHIGGRLAYRQLRNYHINHIEDSKTMGELKSINNIGIHYQYADFTVETPGYWKLGAYNDFDNGTLVMVNGVPTRKYHHKQILKLDFSKLGDAFTDSVRMTLTNLLNEAFVTLFADNQPFISAITPGEFQAPMTYSLTMGDGVEASEKCIYIIEDSQLDIGLLIAVERNASRIFQIIADYLNWNDEEVDESISNPDDSKEEKEHPAIDVYQGAEEESESKKEGVFTKMLGWFKELFKKKDTEGEEGEQVDSKPETSVEETGEELTPKQKKKAEKAAKKAKKAEEKAAKEAKKAEEKAAKEAKKAEQQEERQRKKMEKEAAKQDAAEPIAEESDSDGEALSGDEQTTQGEESPDGLTEPSSEVDETLTEPLQENSGNEVNSDE